MIKRILISAFLLFVFCEAFSQSQQSYNPSAAPKIAWMNQGNLSRNVAFVENKGQFDDIKNAKNKGILFQIEDNNMQISFTPKGLVYRIATLEKASEREWEEYLEKNTTGLKDEEEREKREGNNKEHFIPRMALVEMNWTGANDAIEVVPEDPTANYFNFYRPDIDKDKVFGNVKGFKKLTYKNVYPFIDVEYSIHPTEGIKYSYILHPGANPSNIRMSYSGANIKLDADKNLKFITDAGNVIDHAPLTYSGNQANGKIIDSKFDLLDKNTVGFKLANNNSAITETTVIDPWQVGPSFPANSYTPDDISVDGAGNILVYSYKSGIFGNQRIDKYSPTGTFIWTFDLSANADYNNTGAQGDVKADPAGNVYVCIGLGPNNNTAFYNTIKINSTGTALIWGNSSAGTGANNMMETWTITFNCNFTQFYQSGGGRIIGGTTYFNISVEEPVNAATGVEGTLIQNDTLGDIYCTYYSPDGLVYHMTTDSNKTPDLAGALAAASTGTHNNLVCFNPGTGARLFRVQLGTGYNYIDGDYKAPGSIGMNAMVSSCQYLYTMSGAKLDRWDPYTGAHYNQITIPGGVGGTGNGGLVNSGILTDKCGNVYVGSNGKIYVYSPTLSLINTISGLPGIVFDIAWTNSANTDIVACGGTSNSTTFLADVAVPACVLPNTVTVTATQPTCAAPGTATATATFCGAPYTYSWSNGQTTQVATNLAPGTYTVTVSSSMTCPYSYVETQTVTIVPPPGSPTVTVNSPTVCAGSTATLTASGATTYSWSTGATTNTITASPGATTSYTVTGNTAGCTTTVVATINVTPNPTVTVTSMSVCAGSAGTLTVSGATTYSWNTGAITNTITASPATTTSYTVTGTTSTCTSIAVGTISVTPNPTVTVTSVSVCPGSAGTLTASGATTYTWNTGATGNTITTSPGATTSYTVTGTTSTCTSSAVGTISVTPNPTVTVTSMSVCPGAPGTLTASGATTYTWNTGATGNTITTSPGATTSYTVTGTTSTCTSSAVGTISVTPNPVITVTSATMCPGATSTLTASGGSIYSWSPATGLSSTSGATVTCTNSVSTTYTITGTSVGGCTATATSTVTIGGSISPTVNNATICTGGSATLTANGGSTYSWTPGTGLSATSGSSVTANPTTSTVYTITATSGGCTGTVTSAVTVNPLPTVTVNSSTICVGSSTTLNAGGASTYSWSPGTGLSSTTGASVIANPTVTTGYTVTGTDANGCVNAATTAVTVNPLPTINVNNATYCTGGSATLTATGASTYNWSPATGLSSTTGSSVTASPTSTTSYTITGTDVNGCVNTATTSVTVVTSPTVTANAPTICLNNSATLTANGAVTYSWSPGTGLSSTSGTSVTANPTTTTVYTITGSAGTCSAVGTTTVTVNPLPVVGVSSGTICVGQQTATLTATGAVTYAWSPSTGLSSSSGSQVTANPSSTTSYTVTGTDANGCVNTASTTVTVNPLPTITVNGSLICAGSSTTLNAGGATTYSWSPGTGLSSTTGSSVTANPTSTTQYTVVGIDANGCINGDTATVNVVTNPSISVSSATICLGQQTATLTATGANTYSWTPATGLSSTTGSSVNANPGTTTVYTITGTIGTCTAVNTATVTVNILPTVTATSGTICAGQQTATLNANGAVTYVWSPATGLSSTSGNSVTANPNTTTAYTITGTDVNGCMSTGTSTVTVNPLPLVTASSATICAGFSATITAAGATTYSWNTGATTPSITITPATTTSYTVGGIDINGCFAFATSTVTVNPNLVVTVGSNSPICAGTVLTLTCNPGVTWVWSGPNGFTSNQQNPMLSPATATMTGAYSVTATDANGCTGSATTNVTVNALPVITIGSNSPICVNATLNLTSGGGTAYAWSGPNNFSTVAQNPFITSVTIAAGGIYTVAVVDANSCANTATISVTVNPLPVVTATGATVCVNAIINLSTCNCGVNYSWSGPGYNSNQQNPSIPNATTGMAGTYIVTVTDVNGCVNANVAQVVVNPLPNVTVNTAVICAGIPAMLTAGGALGYAWSPGTGLSSTTGSSVSANPPTTTSYTVTGTDINGCVNSAPTTVTVNQPPVLSAGPTASGCIPVCVTFTNTTSAVGNCSWTFGDGTIPATVCAPIHCFTTAGTFNVQLTMTDANGCVSKDSVKVATYPNPVADFDFTPQPATIEDPIIFYDLSQGAAGPNSYGPLGIQWYLGDVFLADPSANYINNSHNPIHTYAGSDSLYTYYVTQWVQNVHGCKDSVTKAVQIKPTWTFYVPNAFSPNGDGINEGFKGTGVGIDNTTYNLWIFDRWGMLIYYSNDIEKHWDGRIQGKNGDIVQEDLYVWKARFSDYMGKKHEYKGTVSVIK